MYELDGTISGLDESREQKFWEGLGQNSWGPKFYCKYLVVEASMTRERERGSYSENRGVEKARPR